MKESSTYLALFQQAFEEGFREGFQRGAVDEARKILILVGSTNLGQPSARTQTRLAKITDLSQFEALVEKVETVRSWRSLLAQAGNLRFGARLPALGKSRLLTKRS